MSAAEKRASSSSSSTLKADPLLKDLTEKKFSFRNNVKALVSELNDVRSRLTSQEKSLCDESMARQAAEIKARSMEEEVERLRDFLGAEIKARSMEEEVERLRDFLGERDGQMKTSTNELNLKELDDLRSQLSYTQATVEASTATAQSVQSHCLSMLKELDEKNNSLKGHESKVNKLEEQLNHMQKDLRAKELSQKHLKDEVTRIEKEVMHRVSVAGANKDCELKKIIDEISPNNIEKINERLNSKDEDIARLKDEISFLSAHWKLKTEELESQLEKQRRADQELKKRVLKLEFCLQEVKGHIRKLQRVGERRDKDLKELRDQVGMKQHSGDGTSGKKNLWGSSDFKFIITVSMLVLAIIAKR